jgi:hypothetical protein
VYGRERTRTGIIDSSSEGPCGFREEDMVGTSSGGRCWCMKAREDEGVTPIYEVSQSSVSSAIVLVCVLFQWLSQLLRVLCWSRIMSCR